MLGPISAPFAARAAVILATFATLTACSDPTPPSSDICDQAAARVGRPACATTIAAPTWPELGKEVTLANQVRTTRYLLPARTDARLPLVFENQSAKFLNHWDFLRQAFAPELGDIDFTDYVELVTGIAHEFYSGNITEWQPIKAGEPNVFGIVIWDAQTPEQTISCDEANNVLAALAPAVHLRTAVVPSSSLQRTRLTECGNVPLIDPNAYVPYEAYSRKVGFGTVARLLPDELIATTAAGTLSWQQVVVLAEAPFDLEPIVSGIVTGTRQGELSHLNVRAAARGTPNCYVRDAYQTLAAWDGKLVRMECAEEELLIREATLAEAQAHWQNELLPEPVNVPPPDDAFQDLPGLRDAPTTDAAARALLRRRVGGKGAGLATLYQRISPEWQLEGLLIPFAYYQRFVMANGLAAALTAIIDDPALAANPAALRAALVQLGDQFAAGACDAADVATIRQAIAARFAPTTMVRFRSSSNAEDSARFSGAGLHESTNACLADDTDADSTGPSQCDATVSNERGVCRALKKVWASLWLPRAYNERTFYRIGQHDVRMGILVNTRSGDELANAVAFSGDPAATRSAMLINAQLGDLEVVSAEPGVWPEKTFLEVTNGAVTTIDRVRHSSELPDGWILSTEQLRALGAEMAAIDTIMPRDEATPLGFTWLWDTEWKVMADGRLIIKQIRPFLAAAPSN